MSGFDLEHISQLGSRVSSRLKVNVLQWLNVLKNFSTSCWRRWWWRLWQRPEKPCRVPEIQQVAWPSCPGPPCPGSLAHLNSWTNYNNSLLILLCDFDPSGSLESFTSSVIVSVDLDLAELHGREDSLPCSGGGDNARMRLSRCVCPEFNAFSRLFHQANQLSFHLCNPNRPYIAHIRVTGRDIQFQRNYRPYPIAATSPSAVQTLNHKNKSIQCLHIDINWIKCQRANKELLMSSGKQQMRSLIIQNEPERPICCRYGDVQRCNEEEGFTLLHLVSECQRWHSSISISAQTILSERQPSSSWEY